MAESTAVTSLWASLSFFWSLASLPLRTSSPYRIDLKSRVSLSLTPPLRLTQEFPLFTVSLCTSALFYPLLQNCLSVASSSPPAISLTACVEIIPPLLQDTVKLPEHRGDFKIHGQGSHSKLHSLLLLQRGAVNWMSEMACTCSLPVLDSTVWDHGASWTEPPLKPGEEIFLPLPAFSGS